MKIKSKTIQNNGSTSLDELHGFKKWIEEYKCQFIDEKKTKQEIDAYLQTYDDLKEKKEKEEKELTNQPDEEGWVTVTSKSRKANRSALTTRNLEKIKTKQKKRTEKMQLVSFYKFQARDSKKDYIMQLRKKFEEDKNQIEEMKKNRKFKPF